MDSIPADAILQFREDTLQSVRKDYDLDIPGALNQAIDSLEEWVKKQDHFVKKDFPRVYLERIIIAAKGSVERAKKKLDKACSLKTVLSTFYETINFKTDFKQSNNLVSAILPKLTNDNYRVHLFKGSGSKVDGLRNYYRFIISIAEYFWAHDYCRGLHIICDFRDANIIEVAKNLDFAELRKFITVLLGAYGVRIKGIHIFISSKAIETIFAVCKQMLNPKLFQRIQVHKDVESLHKVIEKDILPIEFGGNERPLKEIHEEWLRVLSSQEHQEYFYKIKEAVVNEKFRQTDTFKNEYMGIAGTFRTLSVD